MTNPSIVIPPRRQQKSSAKNLTGSSHSQSPISLFPILSLKSWSVAYVSDFMIMWNILISPLQHRFLRKRSCVTQLLSALHTIGQCLDKNIQTDVLYIYLDFAKVFDHEILVPDIIPEGSMAVYPILVLYYTILYYTILYYTIVYRNITSVIDVESLQQALTNLDSWSHDNNITFNKSKCKVLTVITCKKSPVDFVYHLGTEILHRMHPQRKISGCCPFQ